MEASPPHLAAIYSGILASSYPLCRKVRFSRFGPSSLATQT